MAINEKWIPVILEGISWVKEMFGPSKKELKIHISDLEKQIQSVSAGNTFLLQNQELIMQAILNYLQTDSGYTINADTIVLVGENIGSIDIPKTTMDNTNYYGLSIASAKKEAFDVSEIFKGMDEEIAQAKTTKTSDRR